MTWLPPTPPPSRPPGPSGPSASPAGSGTVRGMAAVAAAATPVVAAALLAVALVATGCRPRVPSPGPSEEPSGAATASAAASRQPGVGPASPDATGVRLLLLVGAPARPRAAVHDLAQPGEPGVPLDLPDPLRDGGLATVVAAPDGRLAAVGQDGAAWQAPPPARSPAGAPAWTPLPSVAKEPGLPGPVLGGTWSMDGSTLVLVAGAPGSGTRRTAIVSVPGDGSAPISIEVPLEADGPAIAALPRGVVAFVGRDLRDRGVLARIAASGSFATLPVAARGVAAGGGLVAIVADDAVRVGTLDELDRGRLPSEPLPLEGPDGIGAVAIAPDGTAVAVVRLDDEGRAARVDVLRRTDGAWAASSSLALDPRDGSAIVGWLP